MKTFCLQIWQMSEQWQCTATDKCHPENRCRQTPRLQKLQPKHLVLIKKIPRFQLYRWVIINLNLVSEIPFLHLKIYFQQKSCIFDTISMFFLPFVTFLPPSTILPKSIQLEKYNRSCWFLQSYEDEYITLRIWGGAPKHSDELFWGQKSFSLPVAFCKIAWFSTKTCTLIQTDL